MELVLLRGNVIEGDGFKRLVQLACLVVRGLGRNLFSVKQAARNGVASIFDMDIPPLETKYFTLRSRALERPLVFHARPHGRERCATSGYVGCS